MRHTSTWLPALLTGLAVLAVDRLPAPVDAGALSGENLVIEVYKQVAPSVVAITTVTLEQNDMFEVVPRRGMGSGFMIDRAGHVLTNHHVVGGARQITVNVGEHKFPATLVGDDPASDLAVVRIKAPANVIRPLPLGDSDHLQVGQGTLAIGNPFGLGQTLTTGVVSAVRDLQQDKRILKGMIQTDAAINQGNSGGPLLNFKGEVIGVNTLIYSPSGGSVGIGFASPINRAKRLLPDLIEKGSVSYPWLGIEAVDIQGELASALNLPPGVLISRLARDGTAAEGGLRGGSRPVRWGNRIIYLGGDLIVAVDGKKVATMAEITTYLENQKRVGDTIRLNLLRDGKPMTAFLRLRGKP